MSTNRTTFRFTDEQKDLITRAAAKMNLSYQTYMKAVCLEHAKRVLNAKNPNLQNLINAPPPPRMEFLDETA